MPRAIWSGSISFGLVNVPVRMYSAISEHKLHFHFVHEPDESPIGYQKVCKLEDRPVPDDEIVKAFEFEPGEYVFMDDEDFEAARAEGYKTIEITDFVPYEQVDPIDFARTYYLGPEEGAGKEVHHAPETEEAAPPDLLEALRASIAAADRGRGRAPRRASRSRNGSRGDLSGLSKAELDHRARKAKIPGRSKMSKDELIEALS